MSEPSLFQNQIKIQRQYMWLSMVWALLTLALGIYITVFWFKHDAEHISEFFKLGPALIAAFITGFPLNIWMKCRVKIATYKELEKLTDEETRKKAAEKALSAIFTNWGEVT